MKLFAIVLLGGLLAGAQGRGKSSQDNKVTEDRGKSAGFVFGDVEVRIIREWFSKPSNLKGLPPGLAKKESLPPGLEKQLRKNGSLPPGLQKKIQPLPHDLEVRLPKLPDGRRRIVISASVILMDEKTNKIFDILEKVF